MDVDMSGHESASQPASQSHDQSHDPSHDQSPSQSNPPAPAAAAAAAGQTSFRRFVHVPSRHHAVVQIVNFFLLGWNFKGNELPELVRYV